MNDTNLVPGEETGETIVIDPLTSIQERYRIFRIGRFRASFAAVIPKNAIEREARCRGLTPKRFAELYDAVWLYGGFDGLYLTFEPKEEEP